MAKPFLKWVGGKHVMLPHLLANLPTAWNKETNYYYEPFVGGGSLFFKLRPPNALISDFNADLINTYLTISDPLKVLQLIDQLKFLQLHNCKDHYYKVRDRFNQTKRISDFIYLNQTGFNGLYRVNASGKYNVPFGTSDKEQIMTLTGIKLNTYFNRCVFDFDNFQLCNEALKSVLIIEQSYIKIKPDAGDFVYFDPPYDGTYTNYNSGGFTQRDQLQLSLFYKSLDAKGVYCMLSNADTPFIRERYKNFNLIEVNSRQNISGTVSGRQPRKELIITNY